MRGRTLGMVIPVLAASLGVLSAFSQAQPNVPAEYQAGIAKLRVAKANLEKAGELWGGNRIRAIQSIDQAFTALGVSPESTPDEMQSQYNDAPGMMNSGISNLKAAKADFAKAGNNWGGRKEKAVGFIDQALNYCQAGIDWAKKNKKY